MNTQTIKQEDLRRAMAKQTLGLPLTGRENSLITLFGQSSTYERENKPVFVEKYLKPLVVALQIGIANVVYRKSDKYDEIVTLIYENGYTTDVNVTADSLSAIVRDVMTGLYDGQYKEYHYSSILPTEFRDIKITHEDREYNIELAEAVYYSDTDETKDLRGAVVNSADDKGNESRQVYSQFVTANFNGMEIQVNIFYTIHEVVDIFTNTVKERHLYLCEEYGNYTGGIFRKATTLSSIDDNLFFGCVNGVVCSFNFDQRNDDGELPPKTYNFDERTIFSGCATLMDNCQIPHLTKTTIKRSTVIKTKSFRNSAAKIKVRTNKTPYKQIARINSALFSFEDMDFSDFSFNTTEQSLFAVKEKEKQWVEKQYFIYSDEYLKPFALYYVSFRYRVAGRYKE